MNKVHSDGVKSTLSFSEKENRCRITFDNCLRNGRRFYHLCTPGEVQQIVFCSKDDYEAGMLIAAISLKAFPGLRIITFEIMSNHIHFILLGTKEEVEAFFSLFKSKLQRFLKNDGRVVDLSRFTANIIEINDLEALRNQIVYTNRNNYVVDSDNTPFTYPYGANGYYFFPTFSRVGGIRFEELTIRERRSLLRSHDIDYPGDYLVVGNYFSPACFCSISLGESMFRDARHYFHKISREIESYKTVAAIVGDSIFYTDDELLSVVYGICRKDYGGQKPALLTASDKIELARTMHFDYNANNGQIARMLKVPIATIESLFPRREMAR